ELKGDAPAGRCKEPGGFVDGGYVDGVNLIQKDGRERIVGQNRIHRKEVKDAMGYGQEKEQSNSGYGGKLSSHVQRYVSFYFTNFPPLLSNFFLRKGFEVCGMLEDVYVANKKNKYGEPYGFVRFSNVKNVPKLTKALNDVWFGHYRVRASVALFNRYNSGEDDSLAYNKGGQSKGVDQIPTKDGSKVLGQPALLKGSEDPLVEQKLLPEKEDYGPMDSVQ
ncbi:RNA recognition motif, partial [Trifolium pratense]